MEFKKKIFFEKCIYTHNSHQIYIRTYIREHFIYRVSYEIIIKVKVSSLLYASCSWKSQLGRPEDSALLISKAARQTSKPGQPCDGKLANQANQANQQTSNKLKLANLARAS